MSDEPCILCEDITPGSLSALNTFCLASGNSLAEQLCKSINGCLLPMLPEHVVCIACQQTVFQLDRLWTEASLLESELLEKFQRVHWKMVECDAPVNEVQPCIISTSPTSSLPVEDPTATPADLPDSRTPSPAPDDPLPADLPSHPTADTALPQEAVPRPTGRRPPRTGPKQCAECGRVYKRWRDLDTHMSTHTGELPFECAECGRRFASRRRLVDHQKGHGEGSTCDVCNKVFRHPSSLQHHRRLHDVSAPAALCPVCCRSLPSPARLRAHLRTHSGERPFQCASCPRAFRQASGLRAHVRLHSTEHAHTCDTCGKGFAGRAAFMSHLQAHGAAPARFACDACGKTFFYRSKMEQHRATHGAEKTSCCELCGAMFATLDALKRHARSHSTARPHACDVCGRRFKDRGVLRKHQRLLHGEAAAAHVCAVCRKRCASPYKLREHMRTHTGERPFACELCPKAFTQAVHLNIHKRSHQRQQVSPVFQVV